MVDLIWVLAALFLALTLSAIWIYNRLVRDRNLVANGWSDIDVQLMRRHDLVPQLVSTVQAYSDYEQATLEAVIALRQHSQQSGALAEKASTEQAIAAGVARLIVVAEDYPELKADQNFRQLATELTEIEEHLQYARRFYNGAVRQLNTRVASFPHLFVARWFGFHAAEFFVAEAQAQLNPKVALD